MKYPKDNTLPRWRFGLLTLSAFTFLLLGGCKDPGENDAHEAHSGHAGHVDEEFMAGFIGLNHTHPGSEDTCFICDSSKRDKGRLWCREHGRYEDRCWACHPELEDKDRLFCREHALYEDECFLCHPGLKKGEGTAAISGPNREPEVPGENKPGELFCNEHGVYERECGICQPGLAASLQPGESLKVRFPSPSAAGKAGIRVGPPVASEITPTISVYCETGYNKNAMARITPLVGGVVRTVYKDLGDKVKTGDPLIEIHSADVADAKSAYLSALVQLDIAGKAYRRLERLDAEEIAAEKDVIQAEGNYRSAMFGVDNARHRLLNFGMTEQAVREIEEKQDASALLTLRAPFDGTLVSRKAVVGEAVDVGHELYTLVNLSEFWLELSIPTEYLGDVALGQTVEAVFSELGELPVVGRITWIDTSIDEKSRMVRARAVVEPGERTLSAGLFGKAFITIADMRRGALLPQTAVQRHQNADFVFVQDEEDLFALRRVKLGARRNGLVEVLQGISPEESVVVSGSFIAMSEFLKFRLGAGCAH